MNPHKGPATQPHVAVQITFSDGEDDHSDSEGDEDEWSARLDRLLSSYTAGPSSAAAAASGYLPLQLLTDGARALGRIATPEMAAHSIRERLLRLDQERALLHQQQQQEAARVIMPGSRRLKSAAGERGLSTMGAKPSPRAATRTVELQPQEAEQPQKYRAALSEPEVAEEEQRNGEVTGAPEQVPEAKPKAGPFTALHLLPGCGG